MVAVRLVVVVVVVIITAGNIPKKFFKKEGRVAFFYLPSAGSPTLAHLQSLGNLPLLKSNHILNPLLCCRTLNRVTCKTIVTLSAEFPISKYLIKLIDKLKFKFV